MLVGGQLSHELRHSEVRATGEVAPACPTAGLLQVLAAAVLCLCCRVSQQLATLHLCLPHTAAWII